MTLVRNSYPHPYSPTVGRTLAPQEAADLSLFAQETDAIATGGLIVMDPSWVPPTPPSPPLLGEWRAPVALVSDLPAAGNDRGDVRLVMADATIYYWDGTAWQALASGPGGVVDLSFAGIDGTGPWIDGAVISNTAGVDGTGPWIDGAVTSTRAGVDGTGPWIDPA